MDVVMKMNWKAKIKNYKDDIVGNSVYDILKFCFQCIITAIISSSAWHKFLQLFWDSPYLIWGVTIVATIVVLIVFLLVYKKIRKHKYHIKALKVDFEYQGDKIIVTSEITVKALRSNLDCIYNRYTWFPDEKSKVRCLTKGFRIKRLPQKDTSYEYYVDFGHKLKKGETVTYKVRVTNDNLHQHFKHFYSREIIAPVDYMKLTVIVPRSYGFNEICRSEIIGSAYSDFSDSKAFDFNGVHIWEIEHPQISYEYKLEWRKK